MLSVLVVDDDMDTREKVARFAKRLGHIVYTAKNGEEGYELYINKLPHVVFADLEMPVMSGLEMCKLIKYEKNDAKIYIMTAHQSPEYMLASIKLSVQDFILKPIDANIIITILKKEDMRRNVVNLTNNIIYSYESKMLKNTNTYAQLTNNEINLLELMLKDSAKTATYEAIENKVYNTQISRNAISSLVKKLRHKLKAISTQHLDYIDIENIQDFGYRLIGYDLKRENII